MYTRLRPVNRSHRGYARHSPSQSYADGQTSTEFDYYWTYELSRSGGNKRGTDI